MYQDELTLMLQGTQRYGGRVAMWHEAGHAVAAIKLRVKVRYLGLDPLPHCLVNQAGLTKHQKGVLLCAGAAMTKVVYGFEWGGTAADYPMAEALGDLEEFKREAYALAYELVAEAKFLVEGRMGTWADAPRPAFYGKDWYVDDVEATFPDLQPHDEHYAACVRVVEKARLGKFGRKAVMAMAKFQMAKPAFVAKWLGV